jgi:hypothetical protein
MRLTRVVTATFVVLSVSCASSQQSGSGSATESQSVTPRAKRAGNVIAADELQAPAIISRDAYAAIRMLRPNFFSYRGPTGSSEAGAGEVMVSHDYGPLMSVQSLKTHNTMGIVEVRFLNAEEAGLRFGLNANGAPVIVLLHNKNQ